jgi:hypothetical protein
MSGVVLRCPNCGTTRAAPGECEACHEAAVRYYCTNHSPGRWLDAPACPQCGARFGVAAGPAAALPRAPAPVPARASAPRARDSAAPPAPTRATRRPRFGERSDGRDATAGEGRREARPPLGSDDGFDDRDAAVGGGRPTLTWADLVRAAARGRRPPAPAPERSAAPIVRGVGGCLLRAVLMLVFLFVGGIAALLLFGGALLQMFGGY